MLEVKLNEPVIETGKEKRRIFAIKNEKGLYLKTCGGYWTDDLNKCLSELRNFDTQVSRARSMLQTRESYDNKKSTCLNFELYYGFEQLFIQEVQVVELNNKE